MLHNDLPPFLNWFRQAKLVNRPVSSSVAGKPIAAVRALVMTIILAVFAQTSFAGILNRNGWVASANNGNSSAASALDGDSSTRWTTGTSQTNGMWFQVDMGSWPAPTFTNIVLDATASPGDYPRGYQVNVSSDGVAWGSPIASGAGSSAVTSISFAAVTARYVRVTQTGSVSGTWWSIHEFNVYGTRLPKIVTGLTAMAGNGQVGLSWTPAPDAATYNVQRSLVSGGSYTTNANGITVTNYIDSNVTNNVTYYYVVSGLSGSGQGSNSLEVSATPTWPPIYTNVTAGNWSMVTWLPNPPGQPFPSIFTTNVFNNTATSNSTNDMGSFVLNRLLFANQAVNLAGNPLVLDGSQPLVTNTQNYAFDIANNLMLDQNTLFGVSANTMTLDGNISGTGSLTKGGPGTLVINNANTYSGGTVVTNGTLTVSTTGSLGSGDVSISTNAICVLQNTNAIATAAYVTADGLLNLAYSGTMTVNRLYIGGISQPAGIWNAARSAVHFAGTGNLNVAAQMVIPNIDPLLDACNVSWNVPGTNSAQSMPIGNGDIGLNVWTETNGDLDFYIGKTDAWGDNVVANNGLMKVGGVHVSLNPRPLVTGANFLQVLKVRTSEITIQESNATLRVWVDANNPVIRVEVTNPQPVSVSVSLNNWRPGSAEDVTMMGQSTNLIWYHRNLAPADPHVANITFGAVISGAGLVNQSSNVLSATSPSNYQLISIYPLTATTATSNQWVTQVTQQAAQIGALDLEQSRTAHQAWWDQFWHRSWVYAWGDQTATNTTAGYVLQRFVTGCGGRGAYPIKFNGSIFIVTNPAEGYDPDTRDWGGQYWMQNTRAMYWPRLMAGDFDIMRPLFNMYAGQLPGNEVQVAGYYGHGGAYFQETAPFWGGLPYMGPEVAANFTAHYFTPILELSMMMLDYYEYTGDATFAQQTLVPVASAGLQFFDQHFGRDANGKLLLDPDNAIEMFWKVHDPAPDIAGLTAVLPRMIGLPTNLVSRAQVAAWTNLLAQLPPLPTTNMSGQTYLLPYTGVQTNASHNGENPELYAIYPFRLYGLGKPNFQVGLNSFNARKQTQMGCWVQDPIQSAMVGLSSVAESYVSYNLTRQDPAQKFPAFWVKGNDYSPDEDNGGNGENGLQEMLMQVNEQTILLLPAWPAGWSGYFKLNAPFQTTVQGTIVNGKVTVLDVLPRSRKVNVIDMSTLTSTFSTGYDVLSAQDTIAPVKQTVPGGLNVLATNGVDFSTGEEAFNVLDGNLGTKYCNKSQDGLNAPGVNTGFVITPALGATVINGFQFATANDVPARDPVTVTVEGSNAANANQAGGGGFVLLYQGTSGLLQNSDRSSWGLFGNFTNTAAYKTYRILVTTTSGGASADGAQYSEVKLMGIPQTPLPGSNVLSAADVTVSLKQTSQGNANVLAVSGTDFSSTESSANVKDGNLGTKYYNTAQDGSNPRGVNTGFVITPQTGYTIIDGIQMGSGNDVRDRDPVSITIEGSNDANAGQAGNNSFTPIWAGPTSFMLDPGRSAYGANYSFINAAAYRSYRVLVTGVFAGDGGGTQYSEARLFGRMITAPAIPTNVVATAGNAQVTLNWPAAAGALGYNVKRATVNNGPYTTLASAPGTNYTDSSSITNGSTYYYVVVATNGPLASLNSVQVSATPQPPLPIILSAVMFSGGQIQLSWTNNASALYYASDITAPIVWTLVTNPPVYSGGQWLLSLPTGTNNRGFYRLQQ